MTARGLGIRPEGPGPLRKDEPTPLYMSREGLPKKVSPMGVTPIELPLNSGNSASKEVTQPLTHSLRAFL